MITEFKGNDLTGKTFGRLFVVKFSYRNAQSKAMWECCCSCPDHSVIYVSGSNLSQGNTTSCGCLQREKTIARNILNGTANRSETIGKIYSRLTVKRIDRVEDSKTYYLCTCSCGKDCVVLGHNLTRGHTQSCGCLQKEMVTTHGLRNHPLYNVWADMKDRCYNPNGTGFQYYGGDSERVISVCDEWRNDFKSFYDWAIGAGYQAGLTLERRNNDGPYAPWNCYWATRAAQSRNTRNNVIPNIEVARNIRSDTRSSSTVAQDYGVSKSTVKNIRSGKSWKEEDLL